MHKTAQLVYRPVDFSEVFYFCTSTLRTYAAEDVAVHAKLIQLVQQVKEGDGEERFSHLFTRELEAIKEIATENMSNQTDVAYIHKLIAQGL